MRTFFVQATYIGASVLMILGMHGFTRIAHARRGTRQAAAGMLLAVAGTLANHGILDYRWIALGIAIGAALGYPLGMWVPMTAMPRRIALMPSLSALAVTLVGFAEYRTGLRTGVRVSHGWATALGLVVLLGSVSVAGALVAWSRLRNDAAPQRVAYRGRDLVNGALFAFTLGLFTFVVLQPQSAATFHLLIAFAFVFGALFVLPAGAEDIPVVVALLNACSGLAACAAGFAIQNEVLIVAGALGGGSGLVLSMLMSRAANRSLADVLFGNHRFRAADALTGRHGGPRVRSITVEDAATQLARARFVIVVPGYGLAVAQAQHQLRELADVIEDRGGKVKYAIHPQAGRVPGHMNMLLAEADVPEDKLFGLEEVNGDFERADVALVVGANDVVNPAVRSDMSSLLHGMPRLDADKARSVVVLKRGMSTGFAGIENQLFYSPVTSMLFGDARESVTSLLAELRKG